MSCVYCCCCCFRLQFSSSCHVVYIHILLYLVVFVCLFLSLLWKLTAITKRTKKSKRNTNNNQHILIVFLLFESYFILFGFHYFFFSGWKGRWRKKTLQNNRLHLFQFFALFFKRHTHKWRNPLMKMFFDFISVKCVRFSYSSFLLSFTNTHTHKHIILKYNGTASDPLVLSFPNWLFFRSILNLFFTIHIRLNRQHNHHFYQHNQVSHSVFFFLLFS